ncbi:hypothetical protein [Proteus phage PM2]|uniref:Uncharacterized protein n=1 Tax=Proteus phage PM2 TaxID=2025809 RepID=A0A249XWV5_9CAUD|nr:hypothetical protein KNT71_gp181 [Proteus phage PM2]ASZ76451.1 hypothetical protein [Proteus phage PM2]
MEINILRGPSGRILTRKMMKNGTMEKLINMFPWCSPKMHLLVQCFEHNISQPRCLQCNKGLNNPNNLYCNPSCQMKYLGGFPKDINKGRTPWNKGKKIGNEHHLSITNPDKWELIKTKISKANSGVNNGMYGWDNKEQREKQSQTMKRKILNGEFTPNTNNRNTCFDVVYNGKNYRSSWEASFASINPNYLYEKIRIPYIGEDNKTHIYIADFFDPKSKEVIEIRPKSLYDENHPKILEAKKYCKTNGYKYIHIDIDYFAENEHLIDYDGLKDSARKMKNAIKKYKRNKKT